MLGVKSQIRESLGDKVFMTIVYFVLAIALIIVLFPLAYIVSASFSSPAAVTAGKVWLWPVEFSLDGYIATFKNARILTGYTNSFIYTLFGTLISVTLTILIAYPLSRKTFYGRNFLMFFIVFTMIFSGGLIPTYLVVQKLGMIDTRWAMILPQAIAVWQVIIARTFFQSTISDDLVEASEMDGCSDLRFLWSVVIPLSKPIIAVLVLMYAVFQWNAYFDALIYLKSADLHPLQLVLRDIIILNTSGGGQMEASEMLRRQELSNLMKYCLIVVASLPVLIIYPFVQKHFVKGVMIGSLKG